MYRIEFTASNEARENSLRLLGNPILDLESDFWEGRTVEER
jgi:hypothetical protein